MEPYINIGTPKTCLFVYMSKRLLNELYSYPFLYDAVEEALFSAKNGYYSIGIIVWYDLLKDIIHVSSNEDSNKRNIPAHDILKTRPTKELYDNLLNKFKKEAKRCYLKESSKAKDKDMYYSEILNEWKNYIKTIN